MEKIILLHQIILYNEIGSIMGRYIVENISLIHEVINYFNDSNTSDYSFFAD